MYKGLVIAFTILFILSIVMLVIGLIYPMEWWSIYCIIGSLIIGFIWAIYLDKENL